MPITIYGTDWCRDTRRSRALLAGHGVRPVFVDIDARPELAAHLLPRDGTPLSIPVVVFDDGARLDEPTNEQLEHALSQRGASAVRHRTALNRSETRFEQYRNDVLVATAGYEERDGTILISEVERRPADHEAERVGTSTADDALERLTTGLVQIARRTGRAVDLAPEPPTDAAETCHLTRRFEALWSEGADHRAATDLARSTGLGRLATIKALHALWEMPLHPGPAALAFGDDGVDGLSAMYHTLNWIIEQNPTATMSELQAFDDATGLSVKTQALSLAGRPRDTIAVVDRIGPGLHLHPISEETARSIAASTIREETGQLRIQDGSTISYAFGWMFLYQSAQYLDTGDYNAMISGNAPLLVDRFTGAIWVTGTEHRPDVYVANYLRTGNPLHGQPPAPLA